MTRPSACSLAFLLAISHVVAITIFLHGFLLARLELSDISVCHNEQLSVRSCGATSAVDHGCWSKPAYDRAVIVIVDALRYDFVFEGNRTGRMPKIVGLLAGAGNAGTAFKFVADTPTITMSRLKAILTGGLPTFLDIGQSFSAAAITEDNLLGQLHARGMRVVVMGDDTWTQLAPADAYAGCHPYPAFDVRDLHTVDDGVWRHLMPYLRSSNASADSIPSLSTPPATTTSGMGVGADGGSDAGRRGGGTAAGSDRMSLTAAAAEAVPGRSPGGSRGGSPGARRDPGWEVLVAHYLGVDHAGHTYGGESPQMYDKLAQMDEQIAAVAAELLAGAAAGAGPYGRTLLLVMGDHGQTMSGDHGGGSDEERDSVLLAFDVGRWRASRDAKRDTAAAATAATAAATVADPEVIPQIDLTPTLALLLGLPVPYGNLGKVNRRLWDVAHGANTQQQPQQQPKGAAAASAGHHDPRTSYLSAIRANAVQVHHYLASYASRGGLPSRELAHCGELLRAADSRLQQLQEQKLQEQKLQEQQLQEQQLQEQQLQEQQLQEQQLQEQQPAEGSDVTRSQPGQCSSNSNPEEHSDEKQAPASCSNGDTYEPRSSSTGDSRARGLQEGEAAEDGLGTPLVPAAAQLAGGLRREAEAEIAAMYAAFLDEAAGLARRKFTRFDLQALAAGCALVLGCVAVHGALLARSCPWRSLLSPASAAVAAAALIHALGLFSANWIQGEGRIQCYSLAATAVLLWLVAAANDGKADAAAGESTADAGAHGGGGGSSVAATGAAAATAAATAAVAQPGVVGCGNTSCAHDHGACSQGVPGSSAAVAATATSGLAVMAAAGPAARGRHNHHNHHLSHHHQQHLHQVPRRGGSDRRALRRQVRLAGMLAVALACNFGLQSYSLIDRWGSDPHDKRQLAAAGVDVGTAAAGGHTTAGQAALSQSRTPRGPPLRSLMLSGLEVLLPLGLLPSLLAALNPGCSRDGAAATTRRTGPSHASLAATAAMTSQRRRQLWRRLQWRVLGAAPFQLIAVWWALQLVGSGPLRELSLRDAAAAAARAAAAPLAGALRVAPAAHQSLLQLAEAAAAPLRILFSWALLPLQSAARQPASSWLQAHATAVLALPLRLLLPRLVYGLAGLALLQLLVVRLALWRRRRLGREAAAAAVNLIGAPPQGGGSGVRNAALEASTASLDAGHALVSGCTAVVVLLLGRRGPISLLLLWAQGVSMLGLLLAGCVRSMSAAAGAARTGTTLPMGSTAAAVAAGGLLAGLGTQAFFLTGHFCEFSGLQYDSPFVGFDSMTWLATPVLFWINSFGALMLSALALPLAAAATSVAAGGGASSPSAKATTAAASELLPAPGDAITGRVMLVAYSLCRSVSLCAAVLSAAIQRHHVVVWALFAPKLVFEVCFAAAAHIALLVAGYWL